MSRRFNSTRRRILTGAVAAAAALGGVLGYRALRRAPLVQLESPPGDLGPLATAEAFDVCVIGSGPAGVVVATRLAEQGYRTLVLESGVELAETADVPALQELETYESSGHIDYPAAATRVRALGGTSNVWTGRCSRLHPLDFEPNAYTPQGAAWPLRYADIEPYYAKAEETMRVRGDALSGYHAPRSGPLPLPGDLDISGLKSLMSGAGVTVDFPPSSTSPQGGGPIRVASDLLPAYLRMPGSMLLRGVTVTGIETDSTGRVTAARVANLDRSTAIVRARSFVIACGGIESARLLLLSKPAGNSVALGNHYGRVGRAFMEHPNLHFTGRIEHSWSTLSPAYEIGRSHQYYDAFKHEGFGSILMVFTQSWLYRDDLERWDIGALTEKAGAVFGRLRQAELRMGATIEMEPRDDNRVMLSSHRRDRFGNPAAEIKLGFSERDLATQQRARELIQGLYRTLDATEVEERPISWSHHHLGTCRMGADPRTSVVDADLRVHGTANLYVAGSAGYVTGGAAHPTLLIVALAHRLADHLGVRLRLSEALPAAASRPSARAHNPV